MVPTMHLSHNGNRLVAYVTRGLDHGLYKSKLRIQGATPKSGHQDGILVYLVSLLGIIEVVSNLIDSLMATLPTAQQLVHQSLNTNISLFIINVIYS